MERPVPPRTVFSLPPSGSGFQQRGQQQQPAAASRFPEPQFGGFRPVKKRHLHPDTLARRIDVETPPPRSAAAGEGYKPPLGPWSLLLAKRQRHHQSDRGSSDDEAGSGTRRRRLQNSSGTNPHNNHHLTHSTTMHRTVKSSSSQVSNKESGQVKASLGNVRSSSGVFATPPRKAQENLGKEVTKVYVEELAAGLDNQLGRLERLDEPVDNQLDPDYYYYYEYIDE